MFKHKGFNSIKGDINYHKRVNSLAPLLLEVDNGLLSHLKEEIFADYEVTMKFTSNPKIAKEQIIVSNMVLVTRFDKFKPVVFTEGVELIEGTPTKMGGSNKWPRIAFEEGYCILKFKCHGLPIVENVGWKCEIIKLTKL